MTERQRTRGRTCRAGQEGRGSRFLFGNVQHLIGREATRLRTCGHLGIVFPHERRELGIGHVCSTGRSQQVIRDLLDSVGHGVG